MKICLINPPFTERFCRGARWQASSKGAALWMPVWLIYATGVLDQAGHETHLIDSPAKKQSRQELLEETQRFDPGMIVIYTATGSIVNDLEITGLLKKACPTAIIVLTGPHVSVLPEDSLRRCPSADYVICREFDYVLRDMAAAMDRGEDPSSLAGVACLRGGKFRANEPPPPIENLDELPFSIQVIEKHLNIYHYHMDYLLYPWVQTYFGRGCYAQCVFCLWPQTLMGRKYRKRSLDSIFAELDYIRDHAPYVKELMIDDDTFTFDLARVREFCERKIAGGYKINWCANVRPNIADVELLKLMKKAGCRAMVAGYESGSPEILKRMKKGITLRQMEQFSEAARKAGIQVHGDFIIGLPGETPETIEETFRAALRLKPATLQVSIALPLPGTEFYDWLKENKYLKTEDFSKFLTPEGAQNVMMDYPGLSGEDMKKAMHKIVVCYYLRPAYLAGALWRVVKDPREAVKFWHAGCKFIKYALFGA
ncbi:MAG: radical SAM protein [Candidatus Omnitrophota bacterium]